MIITALLGIIFLFLAGLIGLLPLGTSLPSAFNSSVSTFFSYLTAFNGFFPMGTLMTILGLEITLELSILGFHFLEWVYHKIRGR